MGFAEVTVLLDGEPVVRVPMGSPSNACGMILALKAGQLLSANTLQPDLLIVAGGIYCIDVHGFMVRVTMLGDTSGVGRMR